MQFIVTTVSSDSCHVTPERRLVVQKLLRIKGRLVAAGGRLTSSGPESGIVDGESPSISLSYIDKTVYKHTHTYAYSVSTESVSHQLGSCLMARYLSSTEAITAKIDYGRQQRPERAACISKTW